MSSPLSPMFCYPVEILPSPTLIGSRIGGSPAAEITPRFDDGHQRYFGTFEFPDVPSFSLFYSLDPLGHDTDRDMLSHNNQVLLEFSLIHVIRHPPKLPASADEKYASLPCHALLIKERCEDTPPVSARSKFGGQPFVDNCAVVGGAFEHLLTNGFRQLLQLDTPNPRQFPDLNGYPWDPGWLHIFYKQDAISAFTFAFVVQQ